MAALLRSVDSKNKAGGMKSKSLAGGRIDHVAIAVHDLDAAISLYRDVFGFHLMAERVTRGQYSGMRSAELDAGGFSIVLLQSNAEDSQVSRYLSEYGPGVQHIAIEVDDVARASEALAKNGMKFSTSVIRGEGLVQIFTSRDANSGMMFEFISRVSGAQGFEQGNVQQLFEQLEESGAY